MHLVTTWFGSFLLDDGKVVRQSLFPPDPEALADRLMRIEEWKVLDEERELVRGLDEFFVSERRLERKAGGRHTTEKPPFLRAEDFGFDRDLLHRAMLALGKRRMRKAVGPDDHLHQAVGAIDDLQESENVLLERLREWYGLHFPELARTADEPMYLDLIATYGTREAMPLDAKDSVGAPLGPAEVDTVRALATLVQETRDRRIATEAYVERSARERARNVAHLVGPLLAARLVSLAGSVDELARLPSSTVQLLGAEKALFRHLRDHKRPPKHGVLFQHPLVHRAPRWQRGAIARAFAGKIAIAARADAYSGRFIADELKADLDRAIANIRERKAELKVTRRPEARTRDKPAEPGSRPRVSSSGAVPPGQRPRR